MFVSLTQHPSCIMVCLFEHVFLFAFISQCLRALWTKWGTPCAWWVRTLSSPASYRALPLPRSGDEHSRDTERLKVLSKMRRANVFLCLLVQVVQRGTAAHRSGKVSDVQRAAQWSSGARDKKPHRERSGTLRVRGRFRKILKVPQQNFSLVLIIEVATRWWSLNT